MSGAIVSLKSEDHYLKVATAGESDLVLYRLGDAIADLAETDGLQVHRSWWVAREAVKHVKAEGGRRELILIDGSSIPVGRSYADSLRKAGWY